uniref:Uncharacterized protein n=1 Tax=Engystomops pustulosus TaxID=76066 RepID=A0AAV6Z563_ENGPU|nr:hypothetical protein GDO81_026574 [Engystomops pustulosus]
MIYLLFVSIINPFLFLQVVRLTWWSLFRDSMYYILAIIALIIFIYDEVIVWWESLILIIMYLIYILIMKYNMKMQHLFTIKRKNLGNGCTIGSELQDGNVYCDSLCDDPTVPLLWKSKGKQTGENHQFLRDLGVNMLLFKTPLVTVTFSVHLVLPPLTTIHMISPKSSKCAEISPNIWAVSLF